MKKNVAFVFPGQGSQTVGMMNQAAESFPVVKKLFAEASEILKYDLWQLISEGPAEKLNQTIYTQPAMLASDIAVWKIWQLQKGFMPAMMAGHSLGEYAALVAAEAIQFSDAVLLISHRAHLMQEAIPLGAGAMAAIIGLNKADIETICLQATTQGVVEAVNFNSPMQIVIAGHVQAVDRAIELAKAQGAKLAKKLNLSIPSHCALMEPAAEKLSAYLKKIKISKPKISVVNNVDVKVNKDPEMIRDALIRQLYRPVRWVEIIQYMMYQGINSVVECGPGKVLIKLNQAINANLKLIAFDDQEAWKKLLD